VQAAGAEEAKVTDRSVSSPQFRLTRAICSPGRSSVVPDAVLAFSLSMAIFYPNLTSQLHSSMTPLIIVLLLVWTNGVLERLGRTAAAYAVIALALTYSLGMLTLTRLIAQSAGSAAAITLEHLLLLLPLSAAAGWVLARTARIVPYLSWLLVVATITVLPAIYEYVADVSLINAHVFVRNGQNRAVVGSDHPLVLGALFLALIPIAMYLGGRYRYLCSIWLYVGIVTTGSNGSKLIGAVVLAVCLVPPLARAVLSTWRPLTVLLAGIAGVLFVGSNWIWTTQIHGISTTDVSNQYRGALYALLPHLLHARPFGYGLSGLPPDTLTVSTTSGILDISKSVDSEMVYGATQFGYIAVLLFAVVAVVGARAAVVNNAIGLSSLSTTLVGLFLAIHSWNSLGTFWFLGFGACAAIVLCHDGTLEWTGLCPPGRESPQPDLNTEIPGIARNEVPIWH
jgi:hypothetical protein